MLMRTETVHRLGVSFHGFVRHADAEAAARWGRRPYSLNLDTSEIDLYPGTTIYPTAAGLFEALEATDAR
jgi:hypothetical protein